MKIALNTTIASQANTGTGHYAANLAAALMRIDGDFEIVIYCRHELRDWFDGQRNGRPVTIRGINFASSMQRIYWEQTKLAGQLGNEAIDLLHSMAFTSPWRQATKTVLTVHDLAFERYPETIPFGKRLYYNSVFKKSIRRAHHIITPTKAVRQEVLKVFDVPPSRISAIHEAVDEDFRCWPAKYATSATLKRFGISKPFLLTVGTLEPRKNLATLFQAFTAAKAAAELPHQLVVVGKHGWLKSKSSASSFANMTDVLFTGYVSRKALHELYAAADAFLFPSFYEGFGLPLLEAFVCNLPVVASDIHAHREVCQQAALLVDAGDVTQWRRSIVKILRDKDLRQRLIVRGRCRADDFLWRKAAEKTLAVYKRVLGDGNN